MLRRKNRKTGTIIVMSRAEEHGMLPDDGPWVTVCEDHNGIVHHPTRRLATDWMTDPVGWCPGCQEIEELK